MNKRNVWFLVLLLIIIIIGVVVWANTGEAPGTESAYNNQNSNMVNKTSFLLTSPSFKNGEFIPAKFTCDAENISPMLEISNVPEGTQSLALVVEDPDIPKEVKESRGIDVFDHWVMFNISPDIEKIGEGEAPGTEGKNSSGNLGYTGPCPPTQYQPTEHRYFFKLFALDTKLNLAEGATKENLEAAMGGHIIAETELTGLYDRAK